MCQSETVQVSEMWSWLFLTRVVEGRLFSVNLMEMVSKEFQDFYCMFIILYGTYNFQIQIINFIVLLSQIHVTFVVLSFTIYILMLLYHKVRINKKYLLNKNNLAYFTFLMPKISNIPGYKDQENQGSLVYSNKFTRVDNNPNIRNAQYYSPIVPIHEVPYNPQFSKSPLASVQLSRKPYRPLNLTQIQHETSFGPTIQPTQIPSTVTKEKLDWKKILMWALTALALILLAIGLYFLIDKLLSKKSNDIPVQVYRPPPTFAKINNPTGVNPIFVNPVPYGSIYSTTINTPYTVPSYNSQPVTYTANPSTSYPVTSPILRESDINLSNNMISRGSTESAAVSSNSTPKPSFKVVGQNSIQPFDVYSNLRS